MDLISNRKSIYDNFFEKPTLSEDVLGANEDLDVPWKIMLYQLYGNEANHFLDSNSHSKKRLNPRLQKLSGGSGSGPLFKILRNESIQRLLNQDDNLPDDLKDTYEAYVHQCVAQNRQPVPRAFCSKENQVEKKYSFYQRKPLYLMKQRQVNLMYRLCQKNQDRAQICIFNNPLPNFDNGPNDSAVTCYIPSYYLSSCPQFSLKCRKNKVPKFCGSVGKTFLTESEPILDEMKEGTDKKDENCLDEQNPVYQSLEMLYDGVLDHRAVSPKDGCKLLYLSHLRNYQGNFAAYFRREPGAPKLLEPSKEIDPKFSREALEALRMPLRVSLPQLVKGAMTTDRPTQQPADPKPGLTSATLLNYLPSPPPLPSRLPPPPIISRMPPVYGNRVPRLNKPQRYTGIAYNRPGTHHRTEMSLAKTEHYLTAQTGVRPVA